MLETDPCGGGRDGATEKYEPEGGWVTELRGRRALPHSEIADEDL